MKRQSLHACGTWAISKKQPPRYSSAHYRSTTWLLPIVVGALAGTLSSIAPRAIPPIIATLLGIGILWIVPFFYVGVVLLGFLTVGIALFERKFTHLMIITRRVPIFVVEFNALILTLALLFFLVKRKVKLRRVPYWPLYVVFFGLGVLHVVRGLFLYEPAVLLTSPIPTGTLLIEVLRDSVMMFYAVFYFYFFFLALDDRFSRFMSVLLLVCVAAWAFSIVISLANKNWALPGNKLLLGFYSVMLFVLFPQLRYSYRVVLFTIWLVLILNNVLSGNVSRALLVGLALGFSFLALIEIRIKPLLVRRRFIFMAMALCIFAIVVIVAYLAEFQALLRSSTVHFRLGTWAEVLRRAIRHPLVGWSFGIPIVTKSMLEGVGSTAATNDPHNTYLALFFRTGLLGLIVFGLITLAWYRRCLIALRSSTSPGTRNTLRVVLGSHVFLTAFGFFNQMLESPHFGIWYWALLGIGMAIAVRGSGRATLIPPSRNTSRSQPGQPSRPQRKPKLLLAMPLPPPYSGQETITEMILASPLQDRFHIIHLDTSNKAHNVNRGKLDFHNVVMTLKTFLRLLWLLWRERPDLANIPMPKNRPGFIKFASLVLPCAWTGVKVVSRSGGGHFDKFYQKETRWMQSLIRFTLRHINAVIVRAECLRTPFEPFIPRNRIWSVYLGLDPTLFDGVPPIETDKGTIVLYVGHISKAKGALDLLQAVPCVLSEHPDTRFWLAGEVLKQERNITYVENPEDIQAAVNHLMNQPDVQQAVELLGVVTGKTKLKTYLQSDIFVLPSYAEGFPFSVLEAMLAGKAVTTTPVGALPEVFEHEKHLLFVRPGDIAGLSRTIIRLIEDVDLRNSLGQAAREIVINQFSLENLANQMEAVFRSVLEE